jgi:hypothetical protein
VAYIPAHLLRFVVVVLITFGKEGKTHMRILLTGLCVESRASGAEVDRPGAPRHRTSWQREIRHSISVCEVVLISHFYRTVCSR